MISRKEKGMERIRMIIDNLEEKETQDRVRSQLENVIGVKRVDLSAGQNYVDINISEETSSAEIHNHLQNNGYKVTDVIK